MSIAGLNLSHRTPWLETACVTTRGLNQVNRPVGGRPTLTDEMKLR